MTTLGGDIIVPLNIKPVEFSVILVSVAIIARVAVVSVFFELQFL